MAELVFLFALVIIVLLFVVLSLISFYVNDVSFYKYLLKQLEGQDIWSRVAKGEKWDELIKTKQKYEKKWSIRLWKFFHQQPA